VLEVLHLFSFTMSGNKKINPEPVTLLDIEKIAAARLPKAVWRFYADGADEQITASRNRAVYDE
jgi:hypothetical protein